MYNHIRGKRLPGVDGVYLVHQLLCNVLPSEVVEHPQLSSVPVEDLVWVKWAGWERQEDCTIQRLSEMAGTMPSAVYLFLARRYMLERCIETGAGDEHEQLRDLFLRDSEGVRVSYTEAPFFCRKELDECHAAASALRLAPLGDAQAKPAEEKVSASSEYERAVDKAKAFALMSEALTKKRRADEMSDASLQERRADAMFRSRFVRKVCTLPCGKRVNRWFRNSFVATSEPPPAAAVASAPPPAAAVASAPPPAAAAASAPPPAAATVPGILRVVHPRIGVVAPITPPRPARHLVAPNAPRRVPPSARILKNGPSRGVRAAAVAIASTLMHPVFRRLEQVPPGLRELTEVAMSNTSLMRQLHAHRD